MAEKTCIFCDCCQRIIEPKELIFNSSLWMWPPKKDKEVVTAILSHAFVQTCNQCHLIIAAKIGAAIAECKTERQKNDAASLPLAILQEVSSGKNVGVQETLVHAAEGTP